jgi:hypothetical protein
MSYTKLANSILTSTIWMENDHTRIVWLTLLAMSNKDGEVQASIPGLANVARVPVESCRAAIQLFLSPDPDSRTKDDEGRRIEEIWGGWLLLNHAAYRELASDEDRKRKAAERQQRMRDREKRKEIVTLASHQISHTDTEAEAEAYSEAEEVKEELKPSVKLQTLQAEEIYAAYPRKVGKPVALRAIVKAFEQIEPAKLLEVTKQFATARNGDVEFCPHPATWFNQERWNDDPATWLRQQPSLPGKPQPGKSLEERISNDATREAYRIIDEFNALQVLQASDRSPV